MTKGRIVCEGDSAEPCKSFMAPFHLGIDQQDRIWVSNSGIAHVTRFPASDPSKAQNFETGINNSGLGIDSQGNVWVTNRFGTGLLGMAHLVDMGVRLKAEGVAAASDYLTKTMSEQKGGPQRWQRHAAAAGRNAISRLAFQGRRTSGPLGGSRGRQRQRLDLQLRHAEQSDRAAVRRAHRALPTRHHTGDQISPPGGYVGGGMQMQTDIGIDPAGNVWAMNNWQDIDSCIGTPKEALSTRCGGQGVVIFYGMAKPVRAPQIGPAQQP